MRNGFMDAHCMRFIELFGSFCVCWEVSASNWQGILHVWIKETNKVMTAFVKLKLNI